MSIHMNREHDEQNSAQERTVLKEWDHLQQSLLAFALAASHSSPQDYRTMIEAYIIQSTEGRARLWREPYIAGSAADNSRLLEVRYEQTRYGMLELSSGYLVSNFSPNIPQNFANLCAVLLALTEHKELVQYQLKQLSPLYTNGPMKLTGRERDVLQGLVCGESEIEMAHRLGIQQTTVHTHIQRLYHRLEVRSSREALLRSFELRLVDWLALPD